MTDRTDLHDLLFPVEAHDCAIVTDPEQLPRLHSGQQLGERGWIAELVAHHIVELVENTPRVSASSAVESRAERDSFLYVDSRARGGRSALTIVIAADLRKSRR